MRLFALAVVLFLISALHRVTCDENADVNNVTVYEGENVTMRCSTDCSAGERSVLFWYLRVFSTNLWLSDFRYKLNINVLDQRQDRFSLSIKQCKETYNNYTTNTLTITDVAQEDSGLYSCRVVEANYTTNVTNLVVLPKYLSNIACCPIHMSAGIGDLVNVFCEDGLSDQLRLYLYDVGNGNKHFLKTLNYSYTYTVTKNDTDISFMCGNKRGETCFTNTLHVIETSIQVLSLNNTQFYAGDKVCFVCIITAGSLVDVEYWWSRNGSKYEMHNSNQYCIREIRQEDDKQLLTCNVSNKYGYATGNTSIRVVTEPTEPLCSCTLTIWMIPLVIKIFLMIAVLIVICKRCNNIKPTDNTEDTQIEVVDIYDGRL